MKKVYLIFASFISLSAAESNVEQKEHIPWRITPNELFGLLQTPVPAHRIGSLVQRAARVVALNPALLKKAEQLSSDVQETIAVEWARHILGAQLKNIEKLPGVERPYLGMYTEFFQDGDVVCLYRLPGRSLLSDEVGIVVDGETGSFDNKICSQELSTKITKETEIFHLERLNNQEIIAYYYRHNSKQEGDSFTKHGIVNIIDRKRRESRLLFEVDGDAKMGTFKVAPNGDIMTLFGCQFYEPGDSYKSGIIPTLKVWDSKTGTLKWQLPIRALDKENDFLINNQGELLVRNVDNDVCLLDETGAIKGTIAQACDAKPHGIHLIDKGDTTGTPKFGLVEGVKTIQFLKHGDVLFVGSHQLKIVNRVTLQEKCTLDTTAFLQKEVRVLANGYICVEEGSIPSTLHVIDTNTYQIIKKIAVGNVHHSLGANDLRALISGELLVLYGNTARIFNMETGSERTLTFGTKKFSTRADSYDPNHACLHDSVAQCEILPTGDIITVEDALPMQEIKLWDGVTCALKQKINTDADVYDCTRKLNILPIGYIVGVENDEVVLWEPYALQEIYRKKTIPEDAPKNHRQIIQVDAHENNDFSVTRGFETQRIYKLSTTLLGLCHKLFPAGEVSMKTMCEISEVMVQEQTLQDSTSQ